jgi:hypothetical protein
LDDNPALTLTIVWKIFTILDCVNIVAAAKEEVRKSTLNGQALPAIEDEYQRIINLHTLLYLRIWLLKSSENGVE